MAVADFKRITKMKKTAILKTPFTLVTSESEQSMEIIGGGLWNIKAEFVVRDNQISLDENGDMFEPEYRLVLEAEYPDKLFLDDSNIAKEVGKDIKEIQTLFEFIEGNKKNLFEELGFHGVII
ncbi:hypothetical protein [Streptococcus suis]|nr:hypothetical protein [Streptococcus suis]MCH1748312.1 hypothetical protein [Streptococcus suis]QBX20965.1 hypothetical protein Javan549_0038 [Streptococcus phage Javan549]WNF72406.1 hypothetical protein RJW53_03925 [Streptococcus suis]